VIIVSKPIGLPSIEGCLGHVLPGNTRGTESVRVSSSHKEQTGLITLQTMTLDGPDSSRLCSRGVTRQNMPECRSVHVRTCFLLCYFIVTCQISCSILIFSFKCRIQCSLEIHSCLCDLKKHWWSSLMTTVTYIPTFIDPANSSFMTMNYFELNLTKRCHFVMLLSYQINMPSSR